ncbi:MAG: hypothetical protein HY827_09620 [Actinobacteria bacterium]|nr:hypothetical protein [Actinomycetota bacterium]
MNIGNGKFALGSREDTKLSAARSNGRRPGDRFARLSISTIFVFFALAAFNVAVATFVCYYTPTLKTTASSSVEVGQPIYDTASLTNGYYPKGLITFKLYGPDDSTCSKSPIFTSSGVPVNGNGTYVSPSYTPSAAGT